MKGKLKNLDMGSNIGLQEYRPDDTNSFGFWLTAGIGSDISIGADNFQIFVCNQVWLKEEQNKKKSIPERYLLVENNYDLDFITSKINYYIENCTGNSWNEIVNKIRKIGTWEFENYKEDRAY